MDPVTTNLPKPQTRRHLEQVARGSYIDEIRRSPALFAFIALVLCSIAARVLPEAAIIFGVAYWIASFVFLLFFTRFHWHNMTNQTRPLWKRLVVLALGLLLILAMVA